MIIKQIIGKIYCADYPSATIDWVHVEWYETSKRLLHKKTSLGKEIVIKLFNETQPLQEGDILWKEDDYAIVVKVLPCEAIVIRPANGYEIAALCYEIGNKHAPLYYQDDELLIPFDKPLHQLLLAAGYSVSVDNRFLHKPLRTSVSPHGHTSSRPSLFSKIMQLTQPST